MKEKKEVTVFKSQVFLFFFFTLKSIVIVAYSTVILQSKLQKKVVQKIAVIKSPQ